MARFRVHSVDRVSQTNRGSFEWLLTDQVPFIRWLRDDNDLYDPLFWITGKPGSGKSTIMRFALEDERFTDLLPESVGVPIAYFFHLRGKSMVQKSLDGMLKEILYQLLRQFPHFYPLIEPVYHDRLRAAKDHPWDNQSLIDTVMRIPQITSIRQGVRDRIFLFIDALDENEDQQENEKMMRMIKDLSTQYRRTVTRSGAPLLKICLASRPWPLFKRELGLSARIPSFAIHDHTVDDIRTYASSLLAEPLAASGFPKTYVQGVLELSNQITEKAKGVFVWVRIVVDNSRRRITDGTPLDLLIATIDEYPEELRDLYEHTVERIPEEYHLEAEIAFMVLFSSRVALTLTELYVATQICIGQSPDSDFAASQQTTAWLASRGGGLLEEISLCSPSGNAPEKIGWRPESIVQFIHQTVQDFVRRGIRGFPSYVSAVGHSHACGALYLAAASLQTFPPHPGLSRISQEVFWCIREIDKFKDQNPNIELKPTSYSLHEFKDMSDWVGQFPCSLLVDYRRQRAPLGSLAVLYHYLDSQSRKTMIEHVAGLQGLHPETFLSWESNIWVSATANSKWDSSGFPFPRIKLPENVGQLRVETIKTKRRARERLVRAIRAVIALNRFGLPRLMGLLVIVQNLYHCQLPLMSEWLITANNFLWAAVGPRLVKDGIDRPRMVRKLLAETTSSLVAVWDIEQLPLSLLAVRPMSNVLWSSHLTLVEILATATPNEEITEDMLLEMTQDLLSFARVPRVYRVMVFIPPRAAVISLIQFCARFRGAAGEDWARMLLSHDITEVTQSDDSYNKGVLDLTFGNTTAAQSVSSENLTKAFEGTMETIPSGVMASTMMLCSCAMGFEHVLRACAPDVKVDHGRIMRSMN
jgi:hypothetical protein